MKESDVVAQKIINLVGSVSLYKNNYFKNSSLFKLKKDISERQFKILVTLCVLKKSTVSEMAEMMGISKSTLSIILTKMVNKDFVKKEYPEHSEDKRKVYFYLSDMGNKKLSSFQKVHISMFKLLYDSFTDEQKRNFKIGIEKLIVISEESQNGFYKIIKQSDIYREIDRVDEIERMAIKMFMFFSGFIEHAEGVSKGKFNVNGNRESLTKNQTYILSCVKSFGYDTITKLENHLCSSGSTVSIAVSKLVTEGYLYKEYPVSGQDGRFVFIKLTEKGEESLLDIKEEMQKAFSGYISTFESEKVRDMNDAIDYLLKAFINPK